MDINDLINQANNAYGSAGKRPAAAPSRDNDDKVSIFANFVKNNIAQGVDKIRTADNIAIQSLQGKADVTDVVVAFAAAEQMVNEVVAVKKSVLAAINDIMKLSF